MPSGLREYRGPIFWAIVVHVIAAILLVIGFRVYAPQSAGEPAPQAIEANIVDAARVEEEARRLREAEERRKAEEAERQRRLQEEAEAARRAREEEERRLAELKAQREAVERAERERQERLAAERAEAERKKREAEEARRRREAEEARKRAEREAEMRAALEAEERRMNAIRAGLLEQYKTAIAQKVMRAWIRPSSAQAGLDCTVRVEQIPGGEVVRVDIVACNGDDVVRRSIEAAVLKASPLPPPPDPALFDRILEFKFRPTD